MIKVVTITMKFIMILNQFEMEILFFKTESCFSNFDGSSRSRLLTPNFRMIGKSLRIFKLLCQILPGADVTKIQVC